MNAMAPSGTGLAAPASFAGFIRHMSGPCLALQAMAKWYGINADGVTNERTHCPRQTDRHADEVLWPLCTRGIRQRYLLRGMLIAEIDTWYAPSRFPKRSEPLISDPHCVLERAIADVHPARRLIAFSGSCIKSERNETMAARIDSVEPPQIATLLTIFGLPAAVCCEFYSELHQSLWGTPRAALNASPRVRMPIRRLPLTKTVLRRSMETKMFSRIVGVLSAVAIAVSSAGKDRRASAAFSKGKIEHGI